MDDFPDAGRDIQVGITTPKYRAGAVGAGCNNMVDTPCQGRTRLWQPSLYLCHIYKFAQQSTQVSKPGIYLMGSKQLSAKGERECLTVMNIIPEREVESARSPILVYNVKGHEML